MEKSMLATPRVAVAARAVALGGSVSAPAVVLRLASSVRRSGRASGLEVEAASGAQDVEPEVEHRHDVFGIGLRDVGVGLTDRVDDVDGAVAHDLEAVSLRNDCGVLVDADP